MRCTTIDEAIVRIRASELVVVVDGEDREDEGDLTMAATHVTAAHINFMLRRARGLVCMPCAPERLDELAIGPMVVAADHGEIADTAFAVSIDHRSAGSGISARDRAMTIQMVVRADTRPDDFVRPGHVFPLRARHGGVLERPGHTEAAVDLMRLAGLPPVAVICEVLDGDGEPARRPRLAELAVRHRLSIITIEQLIEYRASHPPVDHQWSLASAS